MSASYFRAYDESPHWLYSKGRYEESQKVINKIARWNNCEDKNITLAIDTSNQKASKSNSKKLESNNTEGFDSVSDELDTKQEENDNACLKILKHPRFVLVFFICSFGW